MPREQLSNGVTMAGNAIGSLLGGVRSAGGWIWKQATGTVSNSRELLSDREFASDRARAWVGFTILGPIRYYGKLLKWSIAGSAQEQLYASLILGVTLTLASFGILTAVAIVFFGPLFVIGLLRQIPAANATYDRAIKGPIEEGRGQSERWIRNRR